MATQVCGKVCQTISSHVGCLYGSGKGHIFYKPQTWGAFFLKTVHPSEKIISSYVVDILKI